MTVAGRILQDVKRRGIALLDFVFQAWWLDYVLAAILTTVAIIFVTPGGVLDPLGQLPLDERRSAYGDLITIAALLAGFTSVAFTTYLGWQSRAIERLQDAKRRPLDRLWVVLIAAPWLCALALWGVRVADRGECLPDNPARWVALAAMLIVLTSVLRSLWLFMELLPLSTKKGGGTQGTAASPIGIKPKS